MTDAFCDKYPLSGSHFLDICKEFLDQIEILEREHFESAGTMIGERLMEGEVVYAVGCGGHSYLPPMDMFCRAGALVPVSATIDVSTTTTTGGIRSVLLERVPGYMVALFKYFRIGKDDVVLIFNNVGVNPMTIDAALECKRLGAKSIGIAGSPWQRKLPYDHPIRHPSKKNLMDLVDLFIDDYNPVGDAVLKLEGFDVPISPISTITDGYIVRRIEIEAIKYMLSKGVRPPVWVSANLPDGDEKNQQYIDQYFDKVKLM
ncbi:MAG: sugar isomerase domain-containing protein [Spirochaetaceae bacterium]|nr:MAG: sugar isomerase domain-containing protein [Spirochaetaceae bacterium]